MKLINNTDINLEGLHEILAAKLGDVRGAVCLRVTDDAITVYKGRDRTPEASDSAEGTFRSEILAVLEAGLVDMSGTERVRCCLNTFIDGGPDPEDPSKALLWPAICHNMTPGMLFAAAGCVHAAAVEYANGEGPLLHIRLPEPQET